MFEHENYAFGDIHCRGEYPGYLLRHLREEGVELDITDEDRQTLKHTVDFVSFSYYMSVAATADPDTVKGEGNVLGGVPNPTLEATEWGWQVDPTGLRIVLDDYRSRAPTTSCRCGIIDGVDLLGDTMWAPSTASARRRRS